MTFYGVLEHSNGYSTELFLASPQKRQPLPKALRTLTQLSYIQERE